MSKSKHPKLEQQNENGEDLGMLLGYCFRWCEDHEEWELDPDGVHIFDEHCTLEYAEKFIEAHRTKCLSTSTLSRVKAEKDSKPEDEPVKMRGIYRWLPHSAAVQVADVQWEEYGDNEGPRMIPFDIRKLLGM